MRHRFPFLWLGIPLSVLLLFATEAVVTVASDLPTAPGPYSVSVSVPGPHHSRPLRLAWLGDSTGVGVGATGPDASVPRLVARRLGQAVELRVLAGSGARVADVLRDQVPRLAAFQPDAVIVGVGGNDVVHLTERSEFRDRYRAMLRAVARVHPRVLMTIGIGEFGTVPRIPWPLRPIVGWRGHLLDADVRAAAATLGAGYVDLGGLTGPVFAPDPIPYYAGDRFHPNDAGYQEWARVIVPVLRDELDRAGLAPPEGGRP